MSTNRKGWIVGLLALVLSQQVGAVEASRTPISVTATIVHVHSADAGECLAPECDQVFIALLDGHPDAESNQAFILLRYHHVGAAARINYSNIEDSPHVTLHVIRDTTCDAKVADFGLARMCGADGSSEVPPFFWVVAAGGRGLTFDQMGQIGTLPCYRLAVNPYD